MNEINTMEYGYVDSLYARMNDYRTSDIELTDIMREIITIQGALIENLGIRLSELTEEVESLKE